MTKQWEIKAINDDQDTCSICGKKELKRVVWLENQETGEVVYAGTTCAAKLQGIKVKEQRKKETEAVKNAIKSIRKEVEPLKKAHADYYFRGGYKELLDEYEGVFGMERFEAIAKDPRRAEEKRLKKAYHCKVEELCKNWGIRPGQVIHG